MDLYGIKNCNTVKKALTFLDERNVSYVFHDYKKESPKEAFLLKAFERFGWETVINRKGMTWRQLPDDVKDSMDERKALEIAMEKPSIIKRPLVVLDGEVKAIGFKEEEYIDLV